MRIDKRIQKKRNRRKDENNGITHSMIVCAYGESPYLEACVRSVLAQEAPVSICIATSTPNAHIQRIAETYGLPVHVREGGPSGIGYDWNFALSCADTELVTIAHQDDVYSNLYAEYVQRAAMQCAQPLLVFTDYAELRGEKTVTGNRLLHIKRLLLTPLLSKPLWKSRFVRRRILSLGSAICCPAVTIDLKNVSMPVFENNMKSNIDWQAWEKISRQKGEFAYVPQLLMKHRIHEESATSQLIHENGRRAEDLFMYRKFWPAWMAELIERFYQAGEKSNG